MFFKRRRRNRCLRRRQILDVKLSSTVRRQTRLRRVSLVLGGVALTFLLLAALWRGGEWSLRRFVYESPAFTIHHLEVETDGLIALEQIRSWAGVRLRDNLLALDIARVRRDLEMVPSIESAAVERLLPHTLHIRVTEREPIAVTPYSRGREGESNLITSYTVDAKGYFMFPLDPQSLSVPAPTNDHLPMIVGFPATEMRPGRATELQPLRAALRLISAFEHSPMAGLVDLRQIDLSLPGLLVVSTGQSNEVYFALNDPEPQLRRWRSIYDYGVRSGRQVSWLDLSVSNNLPARWAELAFVPPPVRKAPKTSLYRKKHV